MEIGRYRPVFLDRVFAGDFKIESSERLGPELATRIVRGGFPESVHRSNAASRRSWVRDHLDVIIQRDVRDLARIQRPDVLPRLLELAAGQTARLVNVSGTAGSLCIGCTTVREYLTLLSRLFLLEEIPAWHANRLKRLVKTPKLHLADTGLACSLLDLDAYELRRDRTLLGQLLETFVVQEFRRQASGWEHAVRFSHYRVKDKVEVDVILEHGPSRIVAIEVQSAASLGRADRRGLERLRDVTGDCFRCGVLLYDGETLLPLGDRIYAVPLRMLWRD